MVIPIEVAVGGPEWFVSRELTVCCNRVKKRGAVREKSRVHFWGAAGGMGLVSR